MLVNKRPREEYLHFGDAMREESRREDTEEGQTERKEGNRERGI